jgi:molybdopterin molybdotransferase
MNTPLLSTYEAEKLIFSSLRQLEVESVLLEKAAGRVLAEELTADRPMPAYRRATMDGICFHSRDAKLSHLMIAGQHAAGNAPPQSLAKGYVYEIATGAAVPDDCDSIAPYEYFTCFDDQFIQLNQIPNAGEFIHEIGSDANTGCVLLHKGSLMRPVEIAIAATLGKEMIQVVAQPRIVLITTGDEVVSIGENPLPWQIRGSHAAMIQASINLPIHHRHVADDEAEIEKALDELLGCCDLLLITGGISKGKKDFIRSSIEKKRDAPLFHGVAQKPGKPLAFWAGDPLIFALPGNPLSVLATFHRYVIPTIQRMQGFQKPVMKITMNDSMAASARLTLLQPCLLGADGFYQPISFSNSGNLVACAGVDVMIEIPPAAVDYPAGTSFAYYPFNL